ncbi:MAG: hypothetical protein AABO57_17850 [Acidobacteriota bacterium]
MRSDDDDTSGHFTPPGVRTCRRHYYKHSTPTWLLDELKFVIDRRRNFIVSQETPKPYDSL